MEDNELGDSKQKVPDATKARASEDPMMMEFAEIPHKGVG